MPLQLLPMEEADLHAYHSIFEEAFQDDLLALMYPNGYSEEDKRYGVDFQRKEWFSHPDRVKMMKVVDTDLPGDAPYGKIVGVSKWKFYPRNRTAEEMEEEDRELGERPTPPGANAEFFHEFFGMLGKSKKEVVGNKAYAALNVLATLPQHHRRGVGALHMEWGLEEADKLGLQGYIEASPMGKPLYERYGFETVKPLPLDSRKWGLDHDLPHVIMLRPARNANGVAV